MELEQYHRMVDRYIGLRAVLIARERGVPSVLLPDLGMRRDFTELDLQAFAGEVREACGARYPDWRESEPPEGEWTKVPERPDELIPFLDWAGQIRADEFAWRILTSLLTPKG